MHIYTDVLSFHGIFVLFCCPGWLGTTKDTQRQECKRPEWAGTPEPCSAATPTAHQGAPARLAGRRNMARPPASLGSQAPDRDRGEANVVTRVSQWADNHLRLVQVPQPGGVG